MLRMILFHALNLSNCSIVLPEFVGNYPVDQLVLHNSILTGKGMHWISFYLLILNTQIFILPLNCRFVAAECCSLIMVLLLPFRFMAKTGSYLRTALIIMCRLMPGWPATQSSCLHRVVGDNFCSCDLSQCLYWYRSKLPFLSLWRYSVKVNLYNSMILRCRLPRTHPLHHTVESDFTKSEQRVCRK